MQDRSPGARFVAKCRSTIPLDFAPLPSDARIGLIWSASGVPNKGGEHGARRRAGVCEKRWESRTWSGTSPSTLRAPGNKEFMLLSA